MARLRSSSASASLVKSMTSAIQRGQLNTMASLGGERRHTFVALPPALRRCGRRPWWRGILRIIPLVRRTLSVVLLIWYHGS